MSPRFITKKMQKSHVGPLNVDLGVADHPWPVERHLRLAISVSRAYPESINNRPILERPEAGAFTCFGGRDERHPSRVPKLVDASISDTYI